MPVNRLHILLFLGFLCNACVEPFEPVLEESQEVMVISGMISDAPGRQVVTVSRSSAYKNPVFQPLEFCVVTVTDQDGNMIHYRDEGEGVYSADVPDSYLEVGDAVSLHVIAPDGSEYRSSYDTILACPKIDSIYFEITTMETPDPEKSLPGIQFYLDMSGDASDTRNLMWQVEETWEYWAALFGNKAWLADGTVVDYRTNPLFKCWKNYPLDQFYIASTRNLASNELRKMALNFVSNETERLSVTYSLLVKQQSLTSTAYDYFRRVNKQAVESGGLYGVQPSSVPGNIYSVYDEEETVLGFFHGTQVHEQQIFVQNNDFFEFDIPHLACEYEPFSVIFTWPKREYPIYFYVEGPFQPAWTALPECFNCLLQGGDTIRPVNWESWK